MDADAAADPELAMALRISLEEQRAREQQSGADNNETKEDNNQAQPMDQDQQMLQDALLMSMGGGAEAMGGGASMGGAEADLGAMTEEDQIAYAIQMSMAESAAPSDPTTPAAQPEPMEDDSSQLVTDPEFLQTVQQHPLPNQ